MSNEITTTHGAVTNLPAEVSTEIRLLTTSPKPYLDSLPIERVNDVRPATAITLSQCRRGMPREQQIMAVSLLILEVNDFFNVKGKMTANQIKLTAELILDCDSFYDLTLGNIKACFRQKMMTEKLYDRLDGNIIIGWLRQFKSDMAEQCENVNIGLERQRQREESQGDTGAIAHATYMAMLEAKAGDGDEEAQRTLNEIRKRSQAKSPEQQRKEQTDYMRYKAKYLREKGLLK